MMGTIIQSIFLTSAGSLTRDCSSPVSLYLRNSSALSASLYAPFSGTSSSTEACLVSRISS